MKYHDTAYHLVLNRRYVFLAKKTYLLLYSLRNSTFLLEKLMSLIFKVFTEIVISLVH